MIQEFSCVHGHHKHKAGFVMKLGDVRFMVGHICAKSIYNEDFDQYVADIDAAIIRQDALRRVRELRDAIAPFAIWIKQVGELDAFKHWSKLRSQIEICTPWIYQNLTAFAHGDGRVPGTPLPKSLCAASAKPRALFDEVLAEIDKVSSHLAGDPEKAAGIIGALRARMEGLTKRVGAVLDQLQEVELFFQPATLGAICKLANEFDNPKRRTYTNSLLMISVKNDKGHKTLIPMPKGYATPSRRPIEELLSALNRDSTTQKLLRAG